MESCIRVSAWAASNIKFICIGDRVSHITDLIFMHNTRKLICIIQENELCIFHKLFVYNTWKQIVYRGCVWHNHTNVIVLHSFTNMADGS